MASARAAAVRAYPRFESGSWSRATAPIVSAAPSHPAGIPAVLEYLATATGAD